MILKRILVVAFCKGRLQIEIRERALSSSNRVTGRIDQVHSHGFMIMIMITILLLMYFGGFSFLQSEFIDKFINFDKGLYERFYE